MFWVSRKTSSSCSFFRWPLNVLMVSSFWSISWYWRILSYSFYIQFWRIFPTIRLLICSVFPFRSESSDSFLSTIDWWSFYVTVGITNYFKIESFRIIRRVFVSLRNWKRRLIDILGTSTFVRIKSIFSYKRLVRLCFSHFWSSNHRFFEIFQQFL